MQDSLTAIITMPGAIITTPAICPAKEYVTPSLMRMTSVGYCEGRYRHRRCRTPLRIHGKLKEDSLDGSSFLYREKGTHLPLKVDPWGWRNVPQNPHGQRTLLCPGQAGDGAYVTAGTPAVGWGRPTWHPVPGLNSQLWRE